MINSFFIVGEIKKLNVSEPKDPRKNASAVLLIQYGVQRESTNGSVEFVNAAMVRVPSYKYPALKDKIRKGQTVHITGHIQGVFKNNAMDGGFFTAELVADRVDVHSEAPTAKAAPALAEGEAPPETAA